MPVFDLITNEEIEHVARAIASRYIEPDAMVAREFPYNVNGLFVVPPPQRTFPAWKNWREDAAIAIAASRAYNTK